MAKVAVIYWSGTGNTQAMAEAVVRGAEAAGAEVSLFTAAEFDPSTLGDYDAAAFGCPSMGTEQLEESEFEPMFQALRRGFKGQEDRPVRLLRLGGRRVDAELGRDLQRRRRGPCL